VFDCSVGRSSAAAAAASAIMASRGSENQKQQHNGAGHRQHRQKQLAATQVFKSCGCSCTPAAALLLTLACAHRPRAFFTARKRRGVATRQRGIKRKHHMRARAKWHGAAGIWQSTAASSGAFCHATLQLAHLAAKRGIAGAEVKRQRGEGASKPGGAAQTLDGNRTDRR